MNPDHYITLSASNGQDFTALLDAYNVVITGGHGGWEIRQRPKRVSITRWQGKDPYRVDLPIIFQNQAMTQNQEPFIQTLVKMAEPAGHLKQPPTLKVIGSAFVLSTTEFWWVVEDLTWDNQNVTWQRFGNRVGRVRQSVVVHLLQYVDEQIILTSPSPALLNGGQGSAGGRLHTAKVGDTKKTIAQKLYKDPTLIGQIAALNPLLHPDPRIPIPVGQNVVLPPAPVSDAKSLTFKDPTSVFGAPP